jgi:hypothetical protein
MVYFLLYSYDIDDIGGSFTLQVCVSFATTGCSHLFLYCKYEFLGVGSNLPRISHLTVDSLSKFSFVITFWYQSIIYLAVLTFVLPRSSFLIPPFVIHAGLQKRSEILPCCLLNFTAIFRYEFYYRLSCCLLYR